MTWASSCDHTGSALFEHVTNDLPAALADMR